MHPTRALVTACLLPLAAACGGSRPAVVVELPVEVDGSGCAPTVTDLGYRVTLTAARLCLSDVHFTVAGEAHAGLLRRALDRLLPAAHAHPGHLAGGQVTGELPGRFVVDFFRAPPQHLGTGRLLEGAYQGANFAFRRAAPGDGLDPADPLVGHTAALAGFVEKAGHTLALDVLLDLPDGAELVGAVFAHPVAAGDPSRLRLALLTTDPTSDASLFQQIDFAALDPDGEGAVHLRPGDPDHNLLVRALRAHDFHRVTAFAP